MQLRIHEVADRLKVSVKTARRYVRRGLLPAVQYCPRGMLWIDESAVEALKRGDRE
jgi:excisionase family DNA binding protein